MNVEPLISVLMNCRNEEKLISKSIKSVLVQSYKNLELIIWDDASNDNTVNIIQSFKDKRIKLFNNKTHLGLGPSRRQAVKEIKGNFVAILDADDEMEDSRIEKQVNEFKNNEKLALVGTWIRFKDIDDKIISEPFYNKNPFNILCNKEQIRETMLSKNIIANSSIMYKKENAEEVGWYSNDLEYSQDYDLSLKLIKSYDFKILTEFLTYITVRKESMTQSKELKEIRVKEAIFILEKCRSEFAMNKKLASINSREIALNKLKLNLMGNSKFSKKFFFIIKTLFKFPSLIFYRLRK